MEDKRSARGTWNDFLRESRGKSYKRDEPGNTLPSEAMHFVKKEECFARKENALRKRASQGQTYLEEEHLEG